MRMGVSGVVGCSGMKGEGEGAEGGGIRYPKNEEIFLGKGRVPGEM